MQGGLGQGVGQAVGGIGQVSINPRHRLVDRPFRLTYAQGVGSAVVCTSFLNPSRTCFRTKLMIHKGGVGQGLGQGVGAVGSGMYTRAYPLPEEGD